MAYPNMGGQNALRQYGQVAAHSRVEAASPHRLVQMLLEGALEKINLAKGYMTHGQVAEKGSHIGTAISIIDGLRASLDYAAGGEVAQNMGDLYEYMERRLTEANIKNDVEILNEVTSLLHQVKSAWDAIGDEVTKQHATG